MSQSTKNIFYVLRRKFANRYVGHLHGGANMRPTVQEAQRFTTINDPSMLRYLADQLSADPRGGWEIVRVTEKLQSGPFTISTDVQPQALQENKYVIVGLHSLTLWPSFAFWNGVSFGPVREAKQFGSELEAVEYLIAKETRVHGPCGIRRVVSQTLRKEYVAEVVE